MLNYRINDNNYLLKSGLYTLSNFNTTTVSPKFYLYNISENITQYHLLFFFFAFET